MQHALNAPSPTSSPPASATEQSEDEQEQHRADCGVDDRRDDSGAELDAQLGQQPPTDKGPDNSNDEVADDSKSGTLYDLAGQPSCNDADHEYDQKTFIC